MKHDHFIVQSPATPAQQLLLLFHGVGDNPVAMGQIGSWFAPLFPDALIVSIGGAEPCGPPPGRQWFSVQGVSEENRQQRVDAIMPTFIETVRYWQQQSGVSPQATALIAAICTIAMGAIARYPVALATGLGLNALLAYVIAPQMTWPAAMGLVVRSLAWWERCHASSIA